MMHSNSFDKIPMLDLHADIQEQWDAYLAAFEKVMNSTAFINGPEVCEFERECAKYFNVSHAVAMNSGTDALLIGLKALKIGPGDEVITTPFTFFATAEAICHLGAKPIFCDIDPDTFNLNPELIEPLITPKTRAIVPVHLFGQPADMSPIMTLAQKYHLKVLEDNAQSFGSYYHGHKAGTLGDAAALSFFPSKILGGFGDGGMLITNDEEVAHIARMLRSHGAQKKYHNELLGYNSRLDTLQAALLQVKLARIDQLISLRQHAAEYYNQLLSQQKFVITPRMLKGVTHCYHQYTIRITGGKRDYLKKYLTDHGISSMIYYPYPLHQLPYFKSLPEQQLPHAEAASREVLSLPIWPEITKDIQERVVDCIRAGLKTQL